MSKYITLLLLILSSCLFSYGQTDDILNKNPYKKIYFSEPCELIFQFTETDIENNTSKNGVRTSFFTNIPYFMHVDFSKNFGIITGVSIKNIGIKTKNESIVNGLETTTYKKVKRRIFATGLSFAVKTGSLTENLWMYGGGSIDWAFHYRQKLYKGTGNKQVTKTGEWLSDATPRFIPSVFIGMQTPVGFNIKGTYYFNDFLNKDYNGILGDFSKITKSQLFTISISYTIFVSKKKGLQENKNSEKIREL